MSALKNPSWEPVRRGPYYCSPTCGAHCKIVDYDRAGFLAKKIADSLGPNWQPRVHENMRWYASVYDDTGCWRVTINTYEDGFTYTAFLGEPGSAGGKWAESADTPQEAIEKVKKTAKAKVKRLQRMLDAAQIDSKELYRQ